MNAITNAIEQLTAERDKMDNAIKALGSLNNFADANLSTDHAKPRRKKRFSAATRAKMKAAQQARWAKLRAVKKVKRG